ncbi:hypothetical protein EV182_000406 [Spiromyces aspiralis]|uniref:Uncharacterized protein n=1 Tax=Spiromyces aspiralis TaxID=68401 RepID=A0ACC1HNE3_9FUNG|nr:hypothetical protein EV182_000406 [Spiromyces aspiralis]
MKFLSSVLVIALASLAASPAEAQQQQPPCSSTYVRKEVRTLSRAEWSALADSLSRMNNDGWFAWFSYIHTSNFGTIHGNSMFMPFHRMFIQQFESVGRQWYNANFAIPYWDSARDYQAPQNSAVLTSNYIGGNGSGQNSCVSNGLENGWTLTYPNRHCLQRAFNGNSGTIQPWYAPETILSILQRDSTMASFRPDIEFSIHGAVHVGLGGDMNTQWSPNDFAFMLHHANIDRLWYQWQSQYGHTWTMDGPGPNNIRQLSLDDKIIYYNNPIRSVMQLGYGNMCYSYGASTSASTVNTVNRLAVVNPPSTASSSPSEKQVTSQLESNASSDTLAKFFPKLASNNSTLRRRSDSENAQHTPSRVIYYPAQLPESWVKMHNFNPEEVEACYSRAKELIDALVNDNYAVPGNNPYDSSPYSTSATNK